MRFRGAGEGRTDALSQLGGRKQTSRFNDGTCAMNPRGLNGVKPGTSGRQTTRQKTHALACRLDLLVVCSDPGTHDVAEMPGGLLPEQLPGCFSWSRETLAAPSEKRRGDVAHRASRDKTQPPVVADGIIGEPVCHRTPEQASAFGSGSSLGKDGSTRWRERSSSCHACLRGKATRLHQTSSRKPVAPSACEKAQAITRSRAFLLAGPAGLG